MEALRQIPPVNDVLRAEELAAFRDIVDQPFVTEILDNVLSETRRDLAQSKSPASRAELTSAIAGKVAQRIRDWLEPSLRRAISACGVVLYTNLGRAPVRGRAMAHLQRVSAGYSNTESNLAHGK